MLFVRLVWLLLWPVRLPFMLLRRLGARGAGSRTAEAAVVGGVSRTQRSGRDEDDVRSSVLWEVFQREPTDEIIIRPDQQDLAAEWADKMQRYYSLKLELFPKHDFYEETERDHFIAEVAKIETDGASGEDQFVRTLTDARRKINANARTLYCELAPLLLLATLGWHSAMLLADPFHMFAAAEHHHSLMTQLRDGATGIFAGLIALGVAFAFLLFAYRVLYTHNQRQNAQDLNSFIQTEFTCLNQSFNVARSECMQAETRVNRDEHDKVEPYARAWAGAYHWIAIRQLAEELTIRNNMFQIRRNTWLYRVLGAMIAVVLGAAASALVAWISGYIDAPTHSAVVLAHLLSMTAIYVFVGYLIILINPFGIVRSRLPVEEWSRLYKLRVGEAIAEQVGRDKKSIVQQRDRSGG